MNSEIKTIEDLDPRCWEYPFAREGMTLEEFKEESYYLSTHIQELKNGTYIPLWKQREKIQAS